MDLGASLPTVFVWCVDMCNDPALVFDIPADFPADVPTRQSQEANAEINKIEDTSWVNISGSDIHPPDTGR